MILLHLTPAELDQELLLCSNGAGVLDRVDRRIPGPQLFLCRSEPQIGAIHGPTHG